MSRKTALQILTLMRLSPHVWQGRSLQQPTRQHPLNPRCLGRIS